MDILIRIGGVSFSSVSPKLLEDVQELCESFGGVVRWEGVHSLYNRSIGFRVSFPNNFVCCSLPRKVIRLKLQRKKESNYIPNRKIISIKKVNDSLCRCIKVDASDELYLTNNFIVTHNTLQICKIAEYKKIHSNLKHCLIICGVNSLKWNWKREIQKFSATERGIVLGAKQNTKRKWVDMTLEETKEQIRSKPEELFWIINIEKMRYNKKDPNSIINILNDLITTGDLGMIVIDEVHKIKNPDSLQSKGISMLDDKVSKAGLSGTILVNNPLDLYCPMNLIGLIRMWYGAYKKRYVILDEAFKVIGYQNMEEVHDILYKSSLRRTKNLLDLPPKIYKQEWLELSAEETSLMYQIMGKQIALDLDKIEQPTVMAAIITRLRQLTVAGNLLSSTCKKSTKFDRLNDILEEARMNKQKVLVFCPFTEALKLGLEYCKEYNPKLICGGMGQRLEEVKDEHENTEGFSVLFAQEASLGVGQTLVNTEIVVFLSPPWNRANYDQCADRAHRIGQNKTVQIIDLLAKDTYDEMIYDNLHCKGAMSDVVIDDTEIDAVKHYFDKMDIVFSKGNAIKPKQLDLF